MQKKYIPNVLSAIRLCLVPLFVAVFFYNYPHNIWWAVLVFFIAGGDDPVIPGEPEEPTDPDTPNEPVEPDTPADPEEPTEDNDEPESPATGDVSAFGAVAALLLSSAGALTLRKKHN